MAQRARSPPAVGAVHTTRAPTRASRSVTTTSTRARTATSIVTTSRPAYSRRRAQVGRLCNARLIEAGCRIRTGLAVWVRCGRVISVRCGGMAVVDSETEEVVCGEGNQNKLDRMTGFTGFT